MTNYVKQALLLLSAMFLLSSLPAMEVNKLYCETQENPIGICIPKPRLGWGLQSAEKGDKQTAYQIIVSSTYALAEEYRGDVWDSGEVVSSQSQWVVYEGPALEGGKAYYWRVRVRDAGGNLSAWSEVAFWEQAPDQNSLNAQWIGAIRRADCHQPLGNRTFTPPYPESERAKEAWGNVPDLARRSILLRKPVDIDKKIEKAIVYVSGLGHYDLTVNGRKVGDSYFAPLWSDYDKTVYYNTYRIEEWLGRGENVFGVCLGNGFYNVNGERYCKLWVTFGPPTLFFQAHITYDDGTEDIIYSDSSWKWDESPITFNDIYGGEDYDARLEQPGWDTPGFDDSRWNPALVQGPPYGKLTAQQAPPVKIMQTFPVQAVRDVGNDTKVFDMGQNLSGFPSVTVLGKPGQQIRIYASENLHEDGSLNQRRTGSPHYYQYTLKSGQPETWVPRFSYYGYRYLQVTGADYLEGDGSRPVIKELTSNFVHNSVPESGTFDCSNEIFTGTHRIINNAIKSNMQAVFTDCPHREKLGWLEQVHLNGPALFYNFDMGQLISKVLQDMSDSQRANGLVPSIVPEYTDFMAQSWGANFADSPEWGIAVCVSPWQYYDYFGDDAMVRKHYPNMQRYVGYLTSKADHHILSHGLGDWADWHPEEDTAGYGGNSPVSIIATSHYYLAARLTQQSAELMGDVPGAAKYKALAENIKTAYNKEFYDPQAKQYATGSQSSNAVSIYMGLVPPADRQAVLENLVADIRAHGNRLTTGDIGNRYLFRVLADNGYNDVMFDMHNHYGLPGYGFQLAYGMTTLTEHWDSTKGNSLNHFMMAHIEEWFYAYLAGIQSANHSGFREIRFFPQMPGDMTFAKGTHDTLYGSVSAEWKRRGSQYEYTVEVPVNCTATVELPADARNVRLDRKVVDPKEIQLGSGRYTVTWKL